MIEEESLSGSRSPLIAFTPNSWGNGWGSRQRILKGLADRGWPAIYSTGTWTVWDIGSPQWYEAPWFHGSTFEGKVQIDRPGKLGARWPTKPWFDHLALSRHAEHLISQVAGGNNRKSIALLFHPLFFPYLKYLQPSRVIYYAYDAHSLSPDWTEALTRSEEELVERADLVMAFSEGMLERMPAGAMEKGRVLSTGVDMHLFDQALGEGIPRDLASIPSPRIGYTGRINQKLDFALVLEIARQRPEWQWVFIGPVGAKAYGQFAADPESESLWQQCLRLPNVHWLGQKTHEEVPLYLTHLDVNVMCYRTTQEGWWSTIFPLKSMEYLAAGQPIVSAPVQSMRAFQDCLAMVSNAKEWIEAIEMALSYGGVGTRESRRSVARNNGWDDRIDRLEHWILELEASTYPG